MAQQHPPAKERAAEPHEKEQPQPKTLSWVEILDRLLALDERLKKLEEDDKTCSLKSTGE